MDQCPYCENEISGLVEMHARRDYQSWFDIECPYCEKQIEVEVIPVPEFTLHKKGK